jgi:hypothetical protein
MFLLIWKYPGYPNGECIGNLHDLCIIKLALNKWYPDMKFRVYLHGTQAFVNWLKMEETF